MKLPSSIKPMLGRMARQPFDSPDYLYELKWDGMRALAFIEGGELKTGTVEARVFQKTVDSDELAHGCHVTLDDGTWVTVRVEQVIAFLTG